MTRGGRAGLVALLLAALPAGVALVGVRGPITIGLNLGPGDGPYVSGFDPVYEILESRSSQWAMNEAAIHLPIVVDGGPVSIRFLASRVLGDSATTEVTLAGDPVDRFTTRGGAWVERRVEVAALADTPLHLGFRTRSTSESERGVKLDDLEIGVGARGRAHLSGAARWRASLAVALVFALLAWAGLGHRVALAGAALVAITSAAGLALDPWLTHRLLRGVPESLALFGGLGLAATWHLVRSGRAPARDAAIVFGLGLAAFLLRAAAVNHPDFYYPDLRTHARLVAFVRDAGLDFFVHPSRYIAEHGVWRTQAYGRTYAFPYSPAFHLPFTLVAGVGYDGLIAAMKLAAAAWTAVPLALAWVLARRLRVSPLGAVLMLAIPTYTSRLTWAFLPSLFGHAFDLALVVWLVARLDRLTERRTLLHMALLVAAAQLAYVSGVVNTAALVATVAVAVLALGPAPRGRRAAAVCAAGALGALLALALYYRDFLGMAVDVFARGAAHGPEASDQPVHPFLSVLAQRTHSFFGLAWPPLALLGLPLLWRGPNAPAVLSGWIASWLLLMLGRARMPDVFAHGHESLLLTPLVCVAAGAALGWVAERGRGGRVACALAVGGLFVEGLVLQWQALVAQLGNAR